MILGGYPCCDGALSIVLPRAGVSLPVYERETCPHCGAVVWHRLSRVDPVSWTDADFRAAHVVDDEAKTIIEGVSVSP